MTTIIPLRIDFCPELQRVQVALRQHLKRVWPTRRLPLTPPAIAGIVRYDDLGLESFSELFVPWVRAIVLLLPPDLQPHLQAIAGQVPRLRVQPDLDLLSQTAYASWEVQSGPTPQAVWIEAHKLLKTVRDNEVISRSASLPLLLVSGEEVLLMPDWTLPADWLKAADEAIQAAAIPPQASAQQLAAAAVKAEKYSARPWVFMRYELYNRGEHLAVNLAYAQRTYNLEKAAQREAEEEQQKQELKQLRYQLDEELYAELAFQ